MGIHPLSNVASVGAQVHGLEDNRFALIGVQLRALPAHSALPCHVQATKTKIILWGASRKPPRSCNAVQ